MNFQRCLDCHPYWLSHVKSFLIDNTSLQKHSPASLKDKLTRAASYIREASRPDLALEEIRTLPGDCEVAEQLRAIAFAQLGNVRAALRSFQRCLSCSPSIWWFQYNAAVCLISHRKSTEDIKNAVRYFLTALEQNPECVSIHSILAMIFTLAEAWGEGEEHARAAISRGVELGNGLTSLCLMECVFRVSGQWSGPFEASLSGQDISSLISKFPPIAEGSLSCKKSSEMCIFVACDDRYFQEHARALIWSAIDLGMTCSIHVHVFNPGNMTISTLRSLAAIAGPVAVSYSDERVDVSRFAEGAIYYSCARYIRFFEFCQANPAACCVLTDADMLFNSDVRGIREIIGDADVAVLDAPHNPLWSRYIAAAFVANASPRARNVLCSIATCIALNLLSGKGRWFLDQIAIYLSLSANDWGAELCRLPLSEFCDLDHSASSKIWAVVNEQKQQDNQYNRRKSELFAKYNNAIAAIPAFNKVISGKYGKLVCNTNDQYISKSIIQSGAWCDHEIALLSQVLRKGDVVFDVGANIGTHTIPFAHLVGLSGRVLAFEAQRIVFQALCGAVAINSLTNVFAYHMAISDQSGFIKVPRLDPSVFQNFGAVSLVGGGEGPGFETVKVDTIDSFQLDQCNLIKADVEGMEIGVVLGAAGAIMKHRPFLYLENHDNESRPRLIATVAQAGYKLYWHGGVNDPNMFCVPAEKGIEVNGLEKIL